MRTFRYTVLPEDEGRQLKRVIRSRLMLSHHVFSALKFADALIVDGRSVHANHVVRAGEVITLTLKDEPGQGVEPQPGEVDIVYEDEDLLIVNKQAPLACQSSSRQAGGSLENYLAYYYRDQPGFVFRPVNRLDKGTSGLMAVARHAHAQMLLSAQLHTPRFVRRYLAVLEGAPEPPEGVVEAPIAKAAGATVRREVSPGGRYALTRYKTLERRGALSLVGVELSTGRTHQIRVHMRYIGCPVAGDFLYGREDARLPGRFALHSAHLELDHPLKGTRLVFDAPLDGALRALLESERAAE